ncbi:hypothetical protein ACFLSK_03595 [Chloroflexota bacterium]
MYKVKLWDTGGIIRMAEEKFRFTVFGIYLLGNELVRLEWALATVKEPVRLASFIESFRMYERVQSFEDIGAEAKTYHDMLSSDRKPEVSEETKNTLRGVKTRWDILIRERLQGLYLATPMSNLDAKKLIGGIEEFLSAQLFSFLEDIEVADLTEACSCILIGSATAAEHIALRAAESILRRWHECKSGKVLRYKAWGTVLDKLVQEYPNEANRPKEITLLGYLKHRRDEVAHPERISSLAEAEATLITICSLIERIEPILTSAVSKRGRKKQVKKTQT